MQSFNLRLSHSVQQKGSQKVVVEFHNKETAADKAEEAQDQIGFATNWTRAFKKIYQQIKWLNAYAIINEIAAHKILKKFMKEHFKVKDNILDKNVRVMLKNIEFCNRKNLPCII